MVLTLNLKLFLKRESLRGDRGEDGFEPSTGLGLLDALGVVLHWFLGRSFVASASPELAVRQRRLGLDAG